MTALSRLLHRCAAALAIAGLGLVFVCAPGSSVRAQPRAQSDPQVSGHPDAQVQVYAYTFQHKEAAEALALVQPLLTRKGTIELQPEDNTLVIRDTVAALGRIVPSLRAFDLPPKELRIEVMIVRAGSRPTFTQGKERLPEWLEDRLRGLLRWDYYTLLARSGLSTREGRATAHEVGRLYGLSFRPGTLISGNQVKLHDFQIWRVGEEDQEPLLEATLNLWLGKPKVLGLANSESSDRALMVVLTCERLEDAGEVTGSDEGPGGGR